VDVEEEVEEVEVVVVVGVDVEGVVTKRLDWVGFDPEYCPQRVPQGDSQR
jgi:hypothetical protein